MTNKERLAFNIAKYIPSVTGPFIKGSYSDVNAMAKILSEKEYEHRKKNEEEIAQIIKKIAPKKIKGAPDKEKRWFTKIGENYLTAEAVVKLIVEGDDSYYGETRESEIIRFLQTEHPVILSVLKQKGLIDTSFSTGNPDRTILRKLVEEINNENDRLTDEVLKNKNSGQKIIFILGTGDKNSAVEQLQSLIGGKVIREMFVPEDGVELSKELQNHPEGKIEDFNRLSLLTARKTENGTFWFSKKDILDNSDQDTLIILSEPKDVITISSWRQETGFTTGTERIITLPSEKALSELNPEEEYLNKGIEFLKANVVEGVLLELNDSLSMEECAKTLASDFLEPGVIESNIDPTQGSSSFLELKR